MAVDKPMRRISLMLKEEQHQTVLDKGLNMSGLVRDLIDDHFSHRKITVGVDDKTWELYERIVSNTGATDEDLQPYLVKALTEMLDDRIARLESLREKLKS